MSVDDGDARPWATFCLPSAVMSAASQRGPTVNYHNAAVRSFPLLQRARAGEPCSSEQCRAGPRPNGSSSLGPPLLTGAGREAEISRSRLMLAMHCTIIPHGPPTPLESTALFCGLCVEGGSHGSMSFPDRRLSKPSSGRPFFCDKIC